MDTLLKLIRRRDLRLQMSANCLCPFVWNIMALIGKGE